MNKYQYVHKITIEALEEHAKPPIFSRKVDDEYNYDHLWGEPSLYVKQNSIAEVTDIRLSQWKLTFHSKYLDRYQKIVDIVGEERAQAVLKALDG